MAKQTKLTNKDRDQQITWLTNSLIQTSRVLEEYIKFKGDNVDFKKRLVEISVSALLFIGDLIVKTTKSKKDDEMWAKKKPIIKKYK